MLKSFFRKGMTLLLSCAAALSCFSIGASAQTTTAQQPLPAVSSAFTSAYVANGREALPDGSYFIYNINAGTVMTDQLDGECYSFPTYSTGKLEDIETSVQIPQSYFYNITHISGDKYYIRNQSGKYLDIIRTGVLEFKDTPSPLTFTPFESHDGFTYFISKDVDGTSYSISMYLDIWFTVHPTNPDYDGQMMKFYRVESGDEYASLLEQVKNLLDKNDVNMMTLNKGVTSSTIKTLKTKLSSHAVSEEYAFLLDRAEKIANGTVKQLQKNIVPIRKGKNSDIAEKYNKPMFANDSIPTGIWASPGQKLWIYVEADENDPLPSVLFTQHISLYSEKKEVQLKRGINIIFSPQVHEGSFDNYMDPTVEPGGLIYILNPYTESQQSSNVRVHIDGGDVIPTIEKGGDSRAFVDSLKEYYTHYKNGEAGYHDITELYTEFSFMVLTLEKAYTGYVLNDIDPMETINKWDDFINFMMEYDNMKYEDYRDMRLGARVAQQFDDNAAAYAVFGYVCYFNNYWMDQLMVGRYGWGYSHEVGHTVDDCTRTFAEITNNMWSRYYIMKNKKYEGNGFVKNGTKFDMKLIAPEDQNDYWLDELSAATHYFYQINMFWDIEVWHNGYWGALDEVFRKKSVGNSAIDQLLSGCTVKEKFSAYSSYVLGNDMTYYFKKYGFLKNESDNYKRAISLMNLGTQTPKLYYYHTNSYNSPKISNVGKGGQVEISRYDPSAGRVYLNVPMSCADGHLGFEVLKDGKVIDFTWISEYKLPDTSGTYTFKAYDSLLNVYSSVSFSPSDSSTYSSKNVAMVNGTGYTSLSAAVQAAPNGSTVYLLGSCIIDSTIQINKNITLTPYDSTRQILISARMQYDTVFNVTDGGSLTITGNGSKDNMVMIDYPIYYEAGPHYAKNPVFSVSGGYLKLGKGVTVQNTISVTTCGVIYAHNAKIDLNGCIIQFNACNYQGTIGLTGGSKLTCNGGTKFAYNSAIDGSVIYSDDPSNIISISDTEINNNYCTGANGTAIHMVKGTLKIGNGVSVHDNGDSSFCINSAMLIEADADASFSGKLNIPDNVSVCKNVSISPDITGILTLRADSSVNKPGFVLARPSSSQFKDSTFKAIKLYSSYYVLGTSESALTVAKNSPLVSASKISRTSIELGSSVTVTASASGGKAPYKYAVYYKKASSTDYTKLQDYSTNSKVTVTPKAAVKYSILVKIKDSDGKIVKKTFTVSVTAKLTNTSKLSSTSILLGKSITVTASASGGKSPYKYSVYYKKASSSEYTKVQGYSANAKVTVTPKAAVKYNIVVKVKDSAGTVSRKEFTVSVNKELKNSSKITSTKIVLGTTLTVTASASGGKSPYKYAVYYKKASSSDYTKVRDYSTNTKINVTPKAPVSYNVLVKVKDSSGKIVRKVFDVKVLPALANKTVLSSSTVACGKSITVKASASGGMSPYEYTVYYKKSTDDTFTRLQGYSTNTSVAFKPKSKGTYIFRVKVRDSFGNIASKDLKLKCS